VPEALSAVPHPMKVVLQAAAGAESQIAGEVQELTLGQ
jgi:hypothetical protein